MEFSDLIFASIQQWAGTTLQENYEMGLFPYPLL